MKREKEIKDIKINGVKVKIELSKKDFKKFPKELTSTIRIKDKNVMPVSKSSIFL